MHGYASQAADVEMISYFPDRWGVASLVREVHDEFEDLFLALRQFLDFFHFAIPSRGCAGMYTANLSTCQALGRKSHTCHNVFLEPTGKPSKLAI